MSGDERENGLVNVLERIAAAIFYGIAFAAPWYAGAKTEYRWVLQILTAGLAAGGVVTLLAMAVRGWRPVVPLAVFVPMLFLLACVGYWSLVPERDFTGAFRKEQWEALQARMPAGFLDFPRAARLALPASLLVSLVCVVHLGRKRWFRDGLILTIGWSGLMVALYALGERWLEWPSPVWSKLTGKPEPTHAGFFHYSAVAACVNLSWPLLVFRQSILGMSGWLSLVPRLVVLGISGAALWMWPSAAATGIAGAMLVGGVTWGLLGRFIGNQVIRRKLVISGIVAGLAVLAAWQVSEVLDLRKKHPDGWRSAREMSETLEERDSLIRERALTRGDRLVASSIPDRPSARQGALRMAMDHPWVGDGPGAWSKDSGLYTSHTTVNSFFHYLQFVHHDPLQTAAEWGMAPLLAFLVLWVFVLWNLIRGEGDEAQRGSLLLVLTGVSIHGLVDFPLQVPALQIWWVLLLGIASSWRSVRTGRNETADQYLMIRERNRLAAGEEGESKNADGGAIS